MANVPKPRPTYRQRRASLAAETRERILAAAMDLIPAAEGDLSIHAIAKQAGVGVQSIYDHFGSKGGLLVAVVGRVQQSGGLMEGIDAVFRSADGETALRAMTEATLSVWHHGWSFLGFVLRASRTDAVVGRESAELDTLRHAHLWAICRRLEDEGRIRGGQSAEWAADVAFALSAGTVYEELVIRRAWSLQAAAESINTAIAAAVLEPGVTAVPLPLPDWNALEGAAAARAIERGADASRFPAAWRPRASDPRR